MAIGLRWVQDTGDVAVSPVGAQADMLPPYSSAEVAEAVRAGLADAGLRLSELTVAAELPARTWRIAVRLRGGHVAMARYAFAERAGINTPAELATWFAAEAARVEEP